ncbi:unnamed protein product [Prunus armeniaca]|uniref:Uncharacterized protein n=1 Tax=Prunus armeniaca TaxID=36596 RepID=A0A6J5X2I1_PRUAR|nr:unnamed protein product [Prunus armeniaca]
MRDGVGRRHPQPGDVVASRVALSVVTVFGNVLKYLELTVLNGKVGDYDITCQQLCFWGLGGLVASDVELGLEVAARAYAKGVGV